MVKTEVFNSYKVTFVFDYMTISTCVFAMSEEVAEVFGKDAILDEFYQVPGVNSVLLNNFLDLSQDIMVELLDEDVFLENAK